MPHHVLRRLQPTLAAHLKIVIVLSTAALVAAGCVSRSLDATTTPVPQSGVAPTSRTTGFSTTSTSSTMTSPVHSLGDFPELPVDLLPASTADDLQAVLDTSVVDGTFTGISAAVILADEGAWAGASGSWDDDALGLDAPHPTHSSGKTFTAAQTLRLVEEGAFELDDPVSGLVPPELAFYNTNGATVRQLLSMRSGIPSLGGDVYYPGELASSVVEVFEQLPEPTVPPNTVTEYASTNFVLLGSIIENATGRPLSDVLRSDVLAHPGLEDVVYSVDDALASDGFGVEAPVTSLALWAYDLYGGFVISDESLSAMTDFQGQWYGLGVMDFSSEYHAFAIGHQGLSSPDTCCSAIILMAVPEEGLVVAVQANTAGTTSSNDDVDRLAGKLRNVVKR
jgi:CubicO group peptidase (beta-lactamase class C family)